MDFLLFFFFSFVLALVCVPLVRKLAFFSGCVDLPDGKRKIHKSPMPLLGGLAVFLSFAVTVLVSAFLGELDFAMLPWKFILGFLGGGVILMIGGFLDDRFVLPAKLTWIFPALATVLVIACGIGVGIKFLTNPFGGHISLEFVFWGIPLSAVFTFVWLFVSTYTTKILDGLDGLASGVGMISAFALFLLSLRPEVAQDSTALLSLILAGSLMGFLVFAWHPAKIFLGESGSTFIGFALGVLAVLSGAKVATAVLVMGLPILDVIWAVFRRILKGQSPFRGDRKHLHHLLLDAGFSHRKAVLFYYLVSSLFGFTAVFLQAQEKFFALVFLVVCMAGLVGFLTKKIPNNQV